MRSSSLPLTDGAPAVRMSLPPSASTSVREEADTAGIDGFLGVADELVQVVGDRVEAAQRDRVVGAVEVHERHGDRTVLGRAASAGDVVTHHHRQALPDAFGGHLRRRARPPGQRRRQAHGATTRPAPSSRRDIEPEACSRARD